MRLAFKFRYLHTNGLFIRLLDKIKERSSTPLVLYRYSDEYMIEASGEQRELEEMAEQVASMVPASLFLENYGIEELTVPLDPSALGESPDCYEIPCCPECYRRIAETLDPFFPCGVCGFSGKEVDLDTIRTFTGVERDDGASLFTELAQKVMEDGKLSLPTPSGIRRFSLLGSQESKEEGIVIFDPSEMSASWIITQGELKALMTVEKPSVRLKPKLRFRAEYGLERAFYPVFFPDDKVTAALCAALKRRGIEALYCDRIPSLRAVSASERHLIVSSGHDMLPRRYSTTVPQSVHALFGRFRAEGGPDRIAVSECFDEETGEGLRLISAERGYDVEGTVAFEPSHAALRAVAFDNDLGDRPLCGIYLSRRHRSQICAFSPKVGYMNLVGFESDSFGSPAEVLAMIAEADEAGSRLVANYQNAYPALVETIQNASWNGADEASAMVKLWATAGLFIGLCDGGNLHRACEQLEAAALEFNGKSGPRIDYKVSKTPTGYRLDPMRAIRSAMSFKLAGVDDYLLSFGFIDSLADFIAQQAELADSGIAIGGVTIAGDLFENRQLLEKVYHTVSPNYPVYRNRTLAIDGANVALGALLLGHE